MSINNNNNYTAESIQVLSSLDHIKMRRGMYLGETDNPHHLLSEIMDNAIDEVQAGFSKEFVVSVDTKENKYTVRDYGRGIPHGKKINEMGEEKEVLEVLLTQSHSGGKFDNSSYNYSSGLNGLGMTITNALSNVMRVTSHRDKKFVRATVHGTNEVDLEYGKSTEQTGTEVMFVPNGEYFESHIIPLDFIRNRCKISSSLGFKARLIVDGKEEKIESSIFDLMREEKVHTYTQISPIEVIALNNEKMKVALKYTSETNDKYWGFTNLLPNTMGGTHINELSKSICSVWKELIEKNKNLRPSIELKDSDYLIGLRGVCAVFISKPEFSSQTKEKLTVNKKYLEELMDLFKKQFMKFLKQNLDIANQLIKRFEEYRVAQNQLLNRKEISSLIKVNNDSDDNVRRKSIVSKLIECTSKKKQDTEMFIVEGDSAKGPFMYVRNVETQAILPLRGKILNITYKSVKDAIQNKEICDIANSIGCGIGAGCDANKSRYERIIISADADEDGKQIACLVLSVFINLFPDMVRQGKVFLSVPPLYCWGNSSKDFGWCNNIEDIPKSVKHFERFKGLGAMSNAQVKHFLVNPNTRYLIQVDYPSDIDLFNKILGTSEGKNELMRELGVIVSGE